MDKKNIKISDLVHLAYSKRKCILYVFLISFICSSLTAYYFSNRVKYQTTYVFSKPLNIQNDAWEDSLKTYYKSVKKQFLPASYKKARDKNTVPILINNLNLNVPENTLKINSSGYKTYEDRVFALHRETLNRLQKSIKQSLELEISTLNVEIDKLDHTINFYNQNAKKKKEAILNLYKEKSSAEKNLDISILESEISHINAYNTEANMQKFIIEKSIISLKDLQEKTADEIKASTITKPIKYNIPILFFAIFLGFNFVILNAIFIFMNLTNTLKSEQ